MLVVIEVELAPQPFIKWAGGKGQLLDQLAPHLPASFATYYEPFLGGGAMFFALRPARAILGDINEDLIAAYRLVRDDVGGLMTALDTHVYDKEHYYHVRGLDPAAMTMRERAARFLYLNRTCYNGLYRVNRKGQFNVPIGRYRSPLRLYSVGVLRAASLALSNAEIRLGSFEHTLAAAGPGDFAYLDPPYVPLSASANFTSYTRDGFVLFDQQWLKAQFDKLTERGCQALLSNSDTPFTRWLYGDYRIDTVSASRAINSNAEGRQPITEILVRNY